MLIVKDEKNVAEALEFIHQNTILAYDTETTGLNVRNSKVIGFGVSGPIDGFYCPIWTWDKDARELRRCGVSDELINCILSALQTKNLLMFNASFDARVTRANLGVDLLPALHTDVLLLKHTADEEFPFGLKELSSKLFGTNVKDEKEAMLASIRANGGTSTEFYKADTDTLARYCVQDCLLTWRLFSHYKAEISRQNLEDFYYNAEVLALYKEVTIPMEEAGVCLDIDKLETTLNHITVDIGLLELRIQESIIPFLAEVFEPWLLNKEYSDSTNTGKTPKWKLKHGDKKSAWMADNAGAYMFNLQSKFHLKKLFFDTLKLKPLSTTPTGLPQVDEDFLEHIKNDIKWVSQLITYNKLNKLKSTYIVRLLEESENGKFYPAFLQHRTVSGRYAGDLQQLPRPSNDNTIVGRYTSLIREFIIPSPGNKLISADYEQLEPTIFAHVSGDKALQAIFNEGTDFYSEVAIRTERLKDVSSDKSVPNYLGKVDKSRRQRAKAYALGIAYGMTGYKLQFELGVPQDEAEALVANYLAAFPDLAYFMARSKEAARREGFVTSQAGRVRHLPRCKALFDKHGPGLADSLHLWKTLHDNAVAYEAAKADRREYVNLCNNAINFQIQSLAASIVNRAAININRRLKAGRYAARLVMQVHDELVYDCPAHEVADVSCIVKHEMETVMKLSVPLRTEPQIGTNFRECK